MDDRLMVPRATPDGLGTAVSPPCWAVCARMKVLARVTGVGINEVLASAVMAGVCGVNRKAAGWSGGDNAVRAFVRNEAASSHRRTPPVVAGAARGNILAEP